VRATAVFAHCFTCGKDVHAASRIAAELATSVSPCCASTSPGSGSDGEFASTNFSSNVADLVAAAAWLREHRRGAALLVGHSSAARRCSPPTGCRRCGRWRRSARPGRRRARGQPFRRLAGLDEIPAGGEAGCTLAGARSRSGPQFLDDLERARGARRRRGPRRRVAPAARAARRDVGIEQRAAPLPGGKHPKSFVSLDGADHLLGDRADAAYAARMISTWARRYVVDESGAAAPTATDCPGRRRRDDPGPLPEPRRHRGHRFLADEPVAVGGFDAGPTPYDLLGAALGACTSMTLRMYAERKGLALGRIVVEVSTTRSTPRTAPNARTTNARAGPRSTASSGASASRASCPEESGARLLDIANKCPVHRTLEGGAVIATALA
jgi:uncharacterized OsmC-like protein